MGCGGGGVRVRAVLSHTSLTLAIDAGSMVSAVIRRMDEQAGPNVEALSTRAFVIGGEETMMVREYKRVSQ